LKWTVNGGGVKEGDERLVMSSAVFCTIFRVFSFHSPTSRAFFDIDLSEESTFGDGDDAAGDEDAARDETAAVKFAVNAGVKLAEDDIVKRTV
jgi:hypothetical protein